MLYSVYIKFNNLVACLQSLAEINGVIRMNNTFHIDVGKCRLVLAAWDHS